VETPGRSRFRSSGIDWVVLKRFTILGVAAIAAVAVALAVSSGDSDTDIVSGSALAQAASATEKVPGASLGGVVEIDMDALPKPIVMHLEGAADTRGKSARMIGTYENFPKQVAGLDKDGKVGIELISLLPDMYMKSPLFDSVLPDGKSWLHQDLAKTGKQLGIGDPTQFSQGDPSQTVSNLRATSDRVERVGGEDVRGVQTTHYRATVELNKLPALAKPSERAEARQKSQRLIDLIGTDSYPIDVWVDRKHLVRRTSFTMKMTVQGRRMTVRTTTDMYDFGPKPRAKRPPASETYDLP
jgi:hypothetical protein